MKTYDKMFYTLIAIAIIIFIWVAIVDFSKCDTVCETNRAHIERQVQKDNSQHLINQMKAKQDLIREQNELLKTQYLLNK